MAIPPLEEPQVTPTRATRILIVVNLAAFVLISFLRTSGVTWINGAYGAVPARLSADPPGEAVKLVTSLFVHDGFTHLLGNILFLYFFGRKIEDSLGRGKFLLFFLVTGIASALAHYALDPQNSIPLVGASGAVAGILGAQLVLFPTNPLTIFRFTTWKVITFWLVINLFGAVASLAGGGGDTAFFAHLGGFLAGLVLIRFFNSKAPSDTSGWPFAREPIKVARPKIFAKNDDGPFWRT